MAETIRMKMVLSLMFLCLPYLMTVDCRFTGKVTYTYTPKMWQKDLPNSRKLNTIAFIGTRDPPAYKPSTSKFYLPRLLPMTDKLTVGIRVFDMGVRRINNDFSMYNSSVDMQEKFKNLVDITETFLKKNSKEFVIMIMHAESTPINSTMSDCEILRTKYIEKYPNLFVQNWSLDDTVGQHRGKILLLEKSPEFSGCTTSLPCTVRDQQSVHVEDELVKNFDYVKSLKEVLAAQHSRCYLIYYTTEREITYPKYLSASNLISYIHQYNDATPPSTVEIMVDNYFHNTKSYLYITIADLASIHVIDQINESNTKS